MTARNNTLALIFLVAALAFTIFATKRLLFRPRPAPSRVDALLEKAKPVAKPSAPKPSAAVPVQASPAPSSSTPSSSPATSSKPQEQVATSSAGAGAATAKAPPPAAKSAATPTEDHHPDIRRSEDHRAEDHRSEEHRPQLRVASGVRLWIHVTAISRKADGSFTFRGTLLQPVSLANANRLDQGTELAGSGRVNHGHVTVLVSGFTVGGANYALQDTNGSHKRPGTGLAVELDPGKLLEVWLASSSVYRKTR